MLYFNPRSPHGERQSRMDGYAVARQFQSTLPARGATEPHGRLRGRPAISIHAPRTGSDGACGGTGNAPAISIHAPRTGSDAHVHDRRGHPLHFNPRSPHGERRCTRWIPCPATVYFNPRSPHGERRQRSLPRAEGSINFNPRSPHGERRKAIKKPDAIRQFQSTLPARGATAANAADQSPPYFNPRSPHGERRPPPPLETDTQAISIHAPRTGSDDQHHQLTSIISHFNPRSPHGERRQRPKKKIKKS